MAKVKGTSRPGVPPAKSRAPLRPKTTSQRHASKAPDFNDENATSENVNGSTRRYASKVPDFNDEGATSEYVNEIITAHRRELRRLAPLLPRADKLETEAFRLALRGNFGPLANLLRESHPLNDPELAIDPSERLDFNAYVPSFSVLPKGQIRSSLSPRTYALIADILDGTHKRHGRPPATAKDRRKMTPVHDAADLVPMITALLREA